MKRAPVGSIAFAWLLGCSQPSEPSADPVATSAGRDGAVRVDAALLESGRIAIGNVELRSPESDIRATGTVEPNIDGAARIGALTLARVRRLAASEGDRVAAGQLLAVLDAPDAARAAGELKKARAFRQRAHAALVREQKLITAGATSRRELEAARAAVEAHRAEERSLSRLLHAYSAHDGQLWIRAPIAGVVTYRGTELGARVNPGDELYRIVDPERTHVRAEVLERDAALVEPGARANITAGRVSTCAATVEASTRAVDPTSRTLSVRLQPRNCNSLVTGQVVSVTIRAKIDHGSQLVAVPRDAVVDLDGAAVVFTATAEPGAFRVEPVVVSMLTADTAYLTRGPNSGSRIATRGTLLLKGEWMRSSLE